MQSLYLDPQIWSIEEIEELARTAKAAYLNGNSQVISWSSDGASFTYQITASPKEILRAIAKYYEEINGLVGTRTRIIQA